MIKGCIRELKQLRNDKKIIITKCGKGSGVVILNSLDYVKKIMLNDSTIFKHIVCVSSFNLTADILFSYKRKTLGCYKHRYSNETTYNQSYR